MFRCSKCKSPFIVDLNDLNQKIVCSECGHHIFESYFDRPKVVRYERSE